MSTKVESFEAWDPLESTAGADPGILISAQKREIANILRSYTGFYDVFSELLQNALDAVEKRAAEVEQKYKGKIWVGIDLEHNTVEVTDNGCGMDLQQLRQFLRPNFSFKSGASRGSKGVGATYLGYGFNSCRSARRKAENLTQEASTMDANGSTIFPALSRVRKSYPLLPLAKFSPR